jgi:hypothetical protein
MCACVCWCLCLIRCNMHSRETSKHPKTRKRELLVATHLQFAHQIDRQTPPPQTKHTQNATNQEKRKTKKTDRPS